MMRETFLLLMTIMVFCTSCEKNRKIVNTPDGSIAFSIVVEENTRTKTAPVVSEEGISNINIFLYNRLGKLESYCYIDSWDGQESIPLGINSGTEYSIYAIANTGDLTGLPEITEQAGIESLVWTAGSPDDIVNDAGAIPMSCCLPLKKYDDGASVTLKLQRLLSKFRIIADISGLNDDVELFNIKQVRLKNMNSSVRYFGISRAESSEQVFKDGTSIEGNGLSTLFTQGVDFYLTENAQGDLLSDNINEQTHIPPSPYDGLCTYVEFVVDYRNSEHYNDSLVYRYYLHDGRYLDNFDVLRNTMYTCLTSFTGSGINENTWRIDVSGMKDLVTGISVTPDTHTFREKGETMQYTVTVTPASAENPSVRWLSDNEDVATVSPDGTVTAVGDGTCSIIAMAQDGSGVSGSAKAVVDTYKEPSSVTVSPDKAEMYVGETVALSALVLPEDAEDRSVTWISSDPSTASVSEDGIVKALMTGTVYIIVSTDANSLKDTAEIIIHDKIFIINEFPDVLYPNYNSPVKIPYRAEPSGTPSFNITVNSGDASGASVSGDVLTASNPGIKGGEIGTYTLSATVNGITSSRDFSVNAGSIVLSSNITAVYPDYPTRLTIKELSPSDIGVSWSSSDPEIVSINSTGMILPKKLGSCTIKARTTSGAYDEVRVNVTAPSIILADTIIRIYEGNNLELSAGTFPELDYELEYSVISGEEYVSISGNTLTGLKRTPARQYAMIQVRYKKFPNIYKTAEVMVMPCLNASITGNDRMVNTFGHISVGNFSGNVSTYIRLQVFQAPHVDIIWEIIDKEGNVCTNDFEMTQEYVLLPITRAANGEFTITGWDQSRTFRTDALKFSVYQLLSYEVGLGEYSFLQVGNVSYYIVSLFARWRSDSWSFLSETEKKAMSEIKLITHNPEYSDFYSICPIDEKELFIEDYQTNIRRTPAGVVGDLRWLSPLSWIRLDMSPSPESTQGITGSYFIFNQEDNGIEGYYYIKQHSNELFNLIDFGN